MTKNMDDKNDNTFRTVADAAGDQHIEQSRGKCHCGGTYWLATGCGADVCDKCGEHKGFVRCFCGWAASGEDGYQELLDCGETIEADY